MPHSYTNLLYHFVFATKDRLPLLTSKIRPRLYEYLGGTVRGLDGTALEIGGIEDHIHLLAKLRQDIAVAEFIKKLKSNSSRWVRRTLRKDFGWQEGYGGFTVSESQMERVRQYIRNQEEHHRRVSFEEEFKALLRAHHIDYEEDYLWR